MTPRPAALMLAIALTAGAGAATTAPVAATHAVRHLHQDDSGRTITVRRGDTITVRLPGGASGGYHRPRSTDRTVVRRTSASGGYPSAQDARASFVARHRGRADLTSTTDFTCLHTTPRCLPAQRTWVVHVRVR